MTEFLLCLRCCGKVKRGVRRELKRGVKGGVKIEVKRGVERGVKRGVEKEVKGKVKKGVMKLTEKSHLQLPSVHFVVQKLLITQKRTDTHKLIQANKPTNSYTQLQVLTVTHESLKMKLKLREKKFISGLLSVGCYQWVVISGLLSVGCYHWIVISGLLSVGCYQWVVISGLLSVGCYQWVVISGLLSVGYYQWVVISGLLSVGCYQWVTTVAITTQPLQSAPLAVFPCSSQQLRSTQRFPWQHLLQPDWLTIFKFKCLCAPSRPGARALCLCAGVCLCA